MGFIYKVTNKINGHSYIGQTSRNIQERWKEHIRHANSLKHLAISSAIIKYGAENFEVESLEEVPDDQLNEREIFWIANFNTFYGEGYNLTPGGGYESIQISKQKSVLKYSLEGDFLEKYPSLAAAAESVGVHYSAISRCAAKETGKYSCAGFIWRFANDPLTSEDIKMMEENKKNKEQERREKLRACFSEGVSKIDLNTGEIICQYPSLTEAANNEKDSMCLISRDCKKRDLTTFFKRNYIWQKTNELENSPFYKKKETGK